MSLKWLADETSDTDPAKKKPIQQEPFARIHPTFVSNFETMNDPAHLLAEFPPISKADWLQKIQKDLRGKPLSDLNWQLPAGISIDPFPHADDLETLPEPLQSISNGWGIGEDIDVSDISQANGQALSALEFGVEAPRFVLQENPGPEQVASLLYGIDLSLISVHFLLKNNDVAPEKLLLNFYQHAKSQGHDPAQLRGSVNWEANDGVDVVELLRFAQENLPGFAVLPVNGTAFFRGDGNVVEELANTVRQGNDWLFTLTEAGFSAATIHWHLQFSVAVGKNYFIEIAKLRALRLLWANVQRAWGLEQAEMPVIEAHFPLNQQAESPNDNLIQATTQAMSAVIGGADRLTVLPSDVTEAHAQATDFSRRMARNVQHILKMENYFDRVADPAAGSYFLENLTVKLAEAAWRLTADG